MHCGEGPQHERTVTVLACFARAGTIDPECSFGNEGIFDNVLSIDDAVLSGNASLFDGEDRNVQRIHGNWGSYVHEVSFGHDGFEGVISCIFGIEVGPRIGIGIQGQRPWHPRYRCHYGNETCLDNEEIFGYEA
ncbi:hypothetical protein SAMN05216303_102828 [Rhodoferax sp. OV413]|uniref:hypothetical protein n=1 Tax=Rhodoferax sp. OV413 TaxID=1855285 RepID=UPI00088E186B|nr:hypothetical protein [Rhodoferax sp. OV413]SDO97288.1 hypothetical protein SAMN05216303_102828 [Rhodoferax sp. OV413]